MKTDDLRDVVARLDALESLTKLFKNLWFDHIKGEIHDSLELFKTCHLLNPNSVEYLK